MVTEPSNSRKGLDRLLAQHPNYDLIRVENQEYGELPVTDLFGGRPGGFKGPWTVIDLHARDDRVLPILRYAIWNVTGNVYHCNEDGAVADDPFITITPLTDPPEARRRGEREAPRGD